MRSVTAALLWESIFVGIWVRISALLGSLTMSVILFGMLIYLVDRHDPAMINVYRIMIGVSAVWIAGTAVDEQPKLTHLYRFPITTSWIVMHRMLVVAIRAASETFIYISAINFAFQLNLPLGSPVLFSVTTSVCALTAFWACEKSSWHPLVLFVPALPLGIWIYTRFHDPSVAWPAITSLDLILSAGTFVLSIVLSLVFVARNRRGDFIQPEMSRLPWSRRFDDSMELTRRFNSPQDALAWHFWKRCGWITPATMVFAILMTVCVLLRARDKKEQVDVLLGSGFFVGFAAFTSTLFLTVTNLTRKQNHLQEFLATRPITNSDLARSMLRFLSSTSVMAWLLWLIPVLGFRAGFALKDVRLDGSAIALGPLYFGAILAASWTVAAGLATITFTGRALPGMLVIWIPLTGTILINLIPNEVTRESTRHFAYGLSGLALIIALLLAFQATKKRRLMDLKTMLLCAMAWMISCIAIGAAMMNSSVRHPDAYLLAFGLAALVVLPIPTMPLAIGWNRAR